MEAELKVELTAVAVKARKSAVSVPDVWDCRRLSMAGSLAGPARAVELAPLEAAPHPVPPSNSNILRRFSPDCCILQGRPCRGVYFCNPSQYALRRLKRYKTFIKYS